MSTPITPPASPTPASTPEQTPQAPAAAEPQGATPEEPLGTPGLAALQSEREARKVAEKAAADAIAKVKEFEDRDKTEAEKQAEALAQAKAELAEVTIAKTRAEVAAAKGVPAALLTGSTQEELEATADALIAFRGTQAPPAAPVVPGEGTPTHGQGVSQLTADDIKSMKPEEINKARREGRLNKLLGIS